MIVSIIVTIIVSIIVNTIVTVLELLASAVLVLVLASWATNHLERLRRPLSVSYLCYKAICNELHNSRGRKIPWAKYDSSKYHAPKDLIKMHPLPGRSTAWRYYYYCYLAVGPLKLVMVFLAVR